MNCIPTLRRRLVLLAAPLAVTVIASAPLCAQANAAAPRADAARASSPAYELSEVEVMPDLANRSAMGQVVRRNYPQELRRRGESGSVIVRILVQPDGRVDSASVTVENATAEGFDDAATNVARQIRFRPAKVGGRPVAVWVMLPISFIPDDHRRLPTTPASELPPVNGVRP
jgi:protein TonB